MIEIYGTPERTAVAVIPAWKKTMLSNDLGQQIARASTADIAELLDTLFETIENTSQEPKQRLGVIALRLTKKTIRMFNTMVLRYRKAGGRA